MESPSLAVIVLAAGDGVRMQSNRPKPLHRLCGRPMIRYVLDSVEALSARRVVVVVGHGADRMTSELADSKPVTDVVEQPVRRGTGDAVLAGLAGLDDDLDSDGDVVIVPADVPLLRPDALHSLIATHRDTGAAATVLTTELVGSEPAGARMRVARGGRDNEVVRVIDAHDLVGHEHAITELASNIWCVRRSLLAPALRRVRPDNAAGEIHLAGVIEVLAATGHRVDVCPTASTKEVSGINDRLGLATAEAELRRRINLAWLDRGVTMLDPDHTYIDATVVLAPDVTIFPGTILQGDTVIDEGCEIGPDSRIVDCRVGPGSRVEKTMAQRATVGPDCHVGPFAVLQPGSELAEATTTGPFYAPAPDGP